MEVDAHIRNTLRVGWALGLTRSSAPLFPWRATRGRPSRRCDQREHPARFRATKTRLAPQGSPGPWAARANFRGVVERPHRGRSGWWGLRRSASPCGRRASRGEVDPNRPSTTSEVYLRDRYPPTRGNPLRVPATFPARTGNCGGSCPARPGYCAGHRNLTAATNSAISRQGQGVGVDRRVAADPASRRRRR
jgi:hypothetical protein